MARVLIIDDVPSFLREVRALLKKEYTVSISQSPVRGIRKALEDGVDIVVTTLVMREIGGLEVIQRLQSRGFQGAIVMVTRFGDASTAQEAIRLGATDYITRPLVPKELNARLKRALKKKEKESNTPLKTIQEGIRTCEPKMVALLELAHIAADADSRILILGETGTGKELLANAIHRYSRRSREPFVVINCAAIQENLLESELFGHEQGAFTGAIQNRVGRFEQAGAGTLFLDEIGEIPLSLQAKLLRVLQNGEYYRVGGSRRLQSRARIVAATNQDLQKRVDEGEFRADLFYRLNVVNLNLPPLRERPADIPLLAGFFLERFRDKSDTPKHFSPEAISILQRYNWPGNIRELEHLVERSIILVQKTVISPEDLPDTMRSSALLKTGSDNEFEVDTGLPFRLAKQRFEEAYFNSVIERAGGNYSLAARMAGIERTAFFRKAKKVIITR
ncbi:MAG: sigma-54-dependent transcriptional regulator [Puniceicoccales bacterium]